MEFLYGLNPLYYAKGGVLENKTNDTSYPYIGSLKTAIKEEWNRMSKEFIFEGMQIVSKAGWYNSLKKKGSHLE